MPMLRSFWQWGMACLVLFVVVSCFPNRQGAEGDKPLLAVTIAPTASLASELSGGSVDVLTLLPRGSAPELYEPSPHDLAALSRASVYLYVGDLGFERTWLERLGELYPQLPLVRLGESCSTQGSDGHIHPEPGRHDPHYWTSIRGIRLMARNTYQALRQSFPQNDSLYTARYVTLDAELDSLIRNYGAQLSAAPSRGFVIYHPALSDFAEEFTLEQLAIEQDGKEPSPMQLRALVERARHLGVQTVFIQQEFDQKLARGIADELGAKVVLINPLGEDWRGELSRIVEALL